jgi:hypothetical protein
VTLFRKPLYRFVVWAAILVAVAAATAAAGLSWWLIAAIVFAVWIAETIVERRLDGAVHAPAFAAGDGPAVSEAGAAAAPAQAVAPSTRRRRFLPPSAPAASQAAAAAAPPHGEKQWSIWALDKVARETPDAELRFLVLSLQEYADADGMLPLQFDPLVRESFGELLGVATTV